MNNLNEQILRTKELMGLVTEGLVTKITLAEVIKKIIKDNLETKDLELIKDDGGIYMTDGVSTVKSYLIEFNFTKGSIDDLPKEESLAYNTINDTVVFEVGPIISVK
tara:strand:- start:683 stop:1003 length:321 start_codon:yes stop_codon:yes gene_type:complete